MWSTVTISKMNKSLENTKKLLYYLIMLLLRIVYDQNCGVK